MIVSALGDMPKIAPGDYGELIRSLVNAKDGPANHTHFQVGRLPVFFFGPYIDLVGWRCYVGGGCTLRRGFTFLL
jgi:hypothetical protein